jgi:hypothetical protein
MAVADPAIPVNLLLSLKMTLERRLPVVLTIPKAPKTGDLEDYQRKS